MATRSVPVSQHGLGFVVHINTEFLTDTAQNIFGQPHVVTAFNTFGNTNLVFPLARSDFTVDTGNLETSVDHATVSLLHDISSNGIGSSHATVILALGFRESVFGPSQRTGEVTTLFLGHEEFLFNSEPRFMFFGFFHDLVGHGSEVESGRSHLIVNVGFAKSQEGVTVLSEGVFDHTDGFEPDLGITSDGLIARGAIIGPPIELTQFCDFLGVGFGLSSNFLAGTVDPDVFDEGVIIR